MPFKWDLEKILNPLQWQVSWRDGLLKTDALLKKLKRKFVKDKIYLQDWLGDLGAEREVHLKRLKHRQPEENRIHFSSLADQQWSLENPLKVVDTLKDNMKNTAWKNSVFGHISHSEIIEYAYISAVLLNSTVQQPVTLRIGGLLVWIPWLCLAGLWDLTSLLYFRWPFVQIRNSEVIKIGWVRRRPHQWSKVDLQAAK